MLTAMGVVVAVASGVLTLGVLFLSGYARVRAPADNAGLRLWGVAVISGVLTAGVLRIGWSLLFVPQVSLVGPAVWFWFPRSVTEARAEV